MLLRHMKRTSTQVLFRLSMFGFCLMLPAGTFAAEQALRGSIIFASPLGIQQLRLSNRELTTLVPSPKDRGQIHESVLKVDDDRFLFTENLFVGGQSSVIKEYDRRTHAIRAVRDGTAAAYLPEHDKLFFYVTDGTRTGTKLVIADLHDAQAGAREVAAGPFGYPYRVVAVSSREIVFASGDASDNTVQQYDVLTGERRRIAVTGCSLLELWRAATQQLVCWSHARQKHILVGLDGQKVEEAPLPQAAQLVYVEEGDLVIGVLSRLGRSGETWDLWAFELATRKRARLARNIAAFFPIWMP
jgi:hypothetical protein